MHTFLVNLTPHAITLHNDAGEKITLQPTGTVARLAVTRENVGFIRPMTDIIGFTLPVVRPTLGEIENLPDPVAGTAYITSALVAEAAQRPDVLSPGELIRDDKGVIIGALGLCAYVARPEKITIQPTGTADRPKLS